MTEIEETEFKFEISILENPPSRNFRNYEGYEGYEGDMQPGDPLKPLRIKREWKLVAGYLYKTVALKSITKLRKFLGVDFDEISSFPILW